MGVYTRYKGKPGGLRALVELLETTPTTRRERMISVGMVEDPDFTTQALKLMMTWDDVLALTDDQLAEVISKTPSLSVGYAVHNLDEEIKKRFVKCTPQKQAAEVRDIFAVEATKIAIAGGRAKMVESMRACEREGYVKIKRIPENS